MRNHAKLDMDFAPDCAFVGAMDEDRPTPDELISRLFYLVTAKLEDATTEAVAGQQRALGADAVIALAERIHSLGEELIILADVIVALAGGGLET